MSRLAAIGMRGALAVAGTTAMVSGLVFAFQGESAAPQEPGLAAVGEGPPVRPTTPDPVAETNTPSAQVVSPPTVLPADEPSASAVADSAVTAAPRPMTQAVAPAPTSLPTASHPISDIPKYSDVAVLALAADARLPSGRTFRECVELPPSHEKWPTPVHLYYEGKGKWLVETHVSEVQVVFDEATASFTTRNFAPTSPDCAKPR